MISLEAASSAASEGRWEHLLDHLLAAWGECPHAELARAILRLGDHLGQTAVPLHGDREVLVEAWFDTARHHHPLDLPPLLDALPRLSTRQLHDAIEHLGQWPADPRLGRAMTTLAPELHTAATQALAERHQPRPDAALTGAAAAHLASVHRALDRLQGIDPDRAREDELLAHILAHPEDTGARLVYADLLSARADPRGEFIVLQSMNPKDRTEAHERREAALLRACWREWLGPLSEVVIRDGLAFEGGFLSRCRISATRLSAVDACFAHPLWATVADVDITGRYGAIGDRTLEMVLQPCFSELRVLRGIEHIDELAALVTTPPDRPIEVLHLISGRTRDAWHARTLRRPEAHMPHLHTLVVSADTLPTLRWFLDTPQGQGIRTVQVRPSLQSNAAHPWGSGRTMLTPRDTVDWLALPHLTHLQLEAGARRWLVTATRDGTWQVDVTLRYSEPLLDDMEAGLRSIGHVGNLVVTEAPPEEHQSLQHRFRRAADTLHLR